jgi:hypothetical protein
MPGYSKLKTRAVRFGIQSVAPDVAKQLPWVDGLFEDKSIIKNREELENVAAKYLKERGKAVQRHKSSPAATSDVSDPAFQAPTVSAPATNKSHHFSEASTTTVTAGSTNATGGGTGPDTSETSTLSSKRKLNAKVLRRWIHKLVEKGMKAAGKGATSTQRSQGGGRGQSRQGGGSDDCVSVDQDAAEVLVTWAKALLELSAAVSDEVNARADDQDDADVLEEKVAASDHILQRFLEILRNSDREAAALAASEEDCQSTTTISCCESMVISEEDLQQKQKILSSGRKLNKG